MMSLRTGSPNLPRARGLFCGLLSILFAVSATSAEIEFPAEPIRLPSPVVSQPYPGRLVQLGEFRLHLHCSGPSNAPLTVFFESGLGGLSLEWRLVADRLDDRYRACRYDRAGYAWSDVSPYPRHALQLAREAEALLDRAGESAPLILVGHSMGGLVVRLLAERNPQRAAGMVLVDASHERQLERMESAVPGNLLPTGNRFVIAPPSVPDNLPEPERAWASAFSRMRKTYRATHGELQALRESLRQLEHRGAGFDLPLVVIHRQAPVGATAPRRAQRERIWLELQEDLARLSSQGRLLAANGSGHHIHLDEPQLVADAILSIADDIVDGTTAGVNR